MAISRLSTSRLTQGLPKFQSIWDQETPKGALVPIAYSENGSANFSNIPQTFQDLYITGRIRGVNANTIEYGNITINGSNSNIYSYSMMIGTGSSAVTNRNTPVSPGAFYLGLAPGGNASEGYFMSYEIWILNYANTSYTKSVLWKSASELNGSGQVHLGTGQFFQNAGVTSLNIFGSNGTALGSRHSIYGIRAGN
jgi:hypothetical protein